MNRAALIGAAATLDALLGDPPALPHPVRAMGTLIGGLERAARTWTKSTPARERIAGIGTVIAVVGATFLSVRFLLAISGEPGTPRRRAFEILGAASTLAWRNLIDESFSVLTALEAHDLPRARILLARIVGRDTEHLTPSEVARATIETLSESACDGIVAPLFYLTLGGIPLAFAYKAVNTLDSMIGHPEVPYRDFGRFAAKLDDSANFLPARASAAVISGAAQLLYGSGKRAMHTALRDGASHRSPNAGWPEAAIAGALGVRLGGINRYAGIAQEAPFLGAEFGAPDACDVRRAIEIITLATVLATAASMLISAIRDAAA